MKIDFVWIFIEIGNILGELIKNIIKCYSVLIVASTVIKYYGEGALYLMIGIYIFIVIFQYIIRNYRYKGNKYNFIINRLEYVLIRFLFFIVAFIIATSIYSSHNIILNY